MMIIAIIIIMIIMIIISIFKVMILMIMDVGFVCKIIIATIICTFPGVALLR